MRPTKWLVLMVSLCGSAALAENTRLLFLTADFVQRLSGDAERRMHAPVPREIVFRLDKPWEGSEGGYATVMQTESEFRLYYRGGGESTREQTCMATSTDGIHWRRPSLGLYEFEGSLDNNIIWMPERKAYDESHNFFPFIDHGENVSEESRWKAVALHVYPDEFGDRRKMLVTLASSDGIHWRRLEEGPSITKGSFDSLNTAFRDPASGMYYCYSRTSQNGYRFIQRSISRDFSAWETPQSISFPEPPRIHFYTNGIVPVPELNSPGIGDWYVGMPMRFIPDRTSVLGKQTDGVSDAVLIASQDGLNWDFVSHDAWIRPGLDQDNWGNAHGNSTPAHGILKTSDHEWSVYWVGGYGSEAPYLQRGSLRPEGFASLYAGAGGGEALIGPVDLSGCHLVLNASTSAAGFFQIEVLNDNHTPVEGYTMTDGQDIWGDQLSIQYRWNQKEAIPDDASLHGGYLRIRFADSDIYSIRLVQ